MTLTFDHRDNGTPEAAWIRDTRLASVPAARLPARGEHLVVLAAHPDDETLGSGGLIAAAAASGLSIEIVVATDGDASHPDSPTHTPSQLAPRRRDEAVAAIASLDPHATVTFLGLPDGGLRRCRAELEEALTTRLRPGSLVVTPWRGDRHPDHEVCALAARTLLRRRADCQHWQYPIWAWHWADPGRDHLPWSALRRFDLPDDVQAAKRRALACYRSQHEPLSSCAGDEAVLPPRVLAHFLRPFEHFVVEGPHAAGDCDYFDALYAAAQDPWGLADRFYERRKRDLLMAGLPRATFRRAFEPGCAIGLLTERLAERCGELVACDTASRAVDATRARLVGSSNVAVSQRTIPEEWPDGSFDLIVLSEVGYYCDDVDALVSRVRASFAADGVVVGCHWRHPAADHPRTAGEVHDALGRGLTNLAHHVEDDFVLDVWSATDESVARSDGIVA